MNWQQLLALCAKHGKERVLAILESQHSSYENWEADAWAEPEQHDRARRLRAMCLKQDVTIIKLRQMTDADIQAALRKPDKLGA